MKTLKILFVLALLLITCNSYAQRYTYAYPRVDIMTANDTLTTSGIDAAKHYNMGNAYNDVVMHFRNITGATTDTIYVAMKSYNSSGVFKDSILLNGYDYLAGNILVTIFTCPTGQARAFQLNYPWAGDLYYWRNDAVESGNKEIIYFECGNQNK